METRSESTMARPQLWNPLAAGAWGFLLCPAMGALLLAVNWRALSRPDRAKSTTRWFWFFVALQAVVLFAVLFVPPTEDFTRIARPFTFGLMALLMLQARAQAKYVKEELRDAYVKRPWGPPIAIGAAILAATLCFSYLFAGALS